MNFLQFHGDFYCIEYHKAEVACNGILFNNIYEKPYITIDAIFHTEISTLFNKIREIENTVTNYDQSILRSYLQLILALCSKEKQIENKHLETPGPKSNGLNFKTLLDTDYSASKSVSHYADQYGLSVNAFSKKVKKTIRKNTFQTYSGAVNT